MLNLLIVSTNNIKLDNRLLKNISLLKNNNNNVDIFSLDTNVDIFSLDTKELIRNNHNIGQIFHFKYKEYFAQQKFFKKYIIKYFIKGSYLKRLFILFKYSTYIKKNLNFSKYTHIWLQDFDSILLYFF